jgi:hypothetical protein
MNATTAREYAKERAKHAAPKGSKPFVGVPVVIPVSK